MYLLSSLYFLPLRSFFHLRGKKPFKRTPTKTINNNNNKALSRGATHFCFHKCDKSNGATLFSANKLDQSSGLVHSGVVLACREVLPQCFDKSVNSWDSFIGAK